MDQVAFICLSALSLACALGVVLNKNVVNSAMCLLLCLAGIAGLFVQLHAYFLAFILVLVYAGAVVALFLFIIMLLDMQGGQPWRFRALQGIGGFVAAALLLTGLDLLAVRGRLAAGPPVASSVGSSLKFYAYQLFTTYLLPVEVMGFLLLIAMVGVIVISRRAPGAGEPR
ncbi:MAG TPA: NADH-quinone oxidoreductase subunit J [Opitutaceae bacterium]|nr:NADH-quinone oxidoreductase subunit J [Opitutaceae bacterium]